MGDMDAASKAEVMLTDALARTVYGTDNSIYQVEPEAIAVPANAEEIRAVVIDAARRGRAIVARGGGTGTNGQSLTDGVVIDVKRDFNRVLSVDPEARTAVVEPGLVTAQLNRQLASEGLFWAPHTSTLSRATVGGMISTDAAGKGSLIYGRAHRHVLSLDVILDDGTPWKAEAKTIQKAEALASEEGRVGDLWRSLLDLPLDEGVDLELPELARGFSGYGLDRLRRNGMVDPVPLLCGAEGTLAIITQATIRLTPIPTNTLLFIVGYDSFADALDDAVDLASTKPSAIECFDETTLEQGRSSPAWPALAKVVGDHRGSVLLLEYSGEGELQPGRIEAALAATGRSRAVNSTIDPQERAAAWKVRADAVGLLAKVTVGQPERSARPTAFVEDCAVPVAQMGPFIAGFRRVLDRHGLEYGMFGHADVGCVHVRPALDLTDPAHEGLVRSVTDDVVELVARHGGVLWGEHGRGFRGDSVSAFLTPSTIDLMRAVKTAFDPRDRFNPGKLYRPFGSTEPIVGLDEVPLRGQSNRAVPVEIREEYSSAFACNGNGLCHHYDETEVMCPSYKASGDPALSPKGRADLLRAWLARRSGDAPDLEAFEEAVSENLHQCLSCSACSGHCPVEVDIPEMKSRFLEQFYQTRRRPLSHSVLSRFEVLAPHLGRLGPVASIGSSLAGRALGLVDLPTPSRSKRSERPRFDRSAPTDIVLIPDVFTFALEPETLDKAIDVLSSVGYSVSVSDYLPSGKFDHIKGKRTAFADAARAQGRLVERILSVGATPVVIEPAVQLLHSHEYPTISAVSRGGRVSSLAEVLDVRRNELSPKGPRGVTLLGHCTERATSPTTIQAWIRVLEAVGYSVSSPDIGCCGMAGIFGHEEGNQDMSRSLWELTWATHAAESEDRHLAATGYSCRSQAKRFSSANLRHPIHLL